MFCSSVKLTNTDRRPARTSDLKRSIEQPSRKRCGSLFGSHVQCIKEVRCSSSHGCWDTQRLLGRLIAQGRSAERQIASAEGARVQPLRVEDDGADELEPRDARQIIRRQVPKLSQRSVEKNLHTQKGTGEQGRGGVIDRIDRGQRARRIVGN